MTDTGTCSATALVINKDINQLEFLSKLLRKSGVETMTFTEAESALKAMDKESPPSLIVTDLYMPVINGWKFCRMVRSPAFEPFNEIPVIVVSSVFSEKMAIDLMSDLQTDAFLPYPPDENHFIEKVHALIAGEKSEKPSVLIVEDDKNLLSVIKNIFERHGYMVHTALTACEAAEVFKKTSCHIAVLNYNLPDRKGDTLLRDFCSGNPDCICLMMAGDITSELALKWITDGADCIKKPFEPEQLMELCGRVRREKVFIEAQKRLEIKTYESTERKENEELLEQSEKQFRFMVEKLQSGAVYVEEDRVFLNRAAEIITGYKAEEIKTVEEWFTRLYKEKACAIKNLYEADRRDDFPSRTVEILTKMGEIKLIEFFSYAEQDRAIWLLNDITDRKKSEDLLRKSEENLSKTNQIMSAVLEHTHIMSVLLDPQFNFIWVNRSYADTCGYASSFFPGKNHFDLYPHEENQNIFQKVIDTGEPFFVSAKPFEFPEHPERGITYWDWSLIPVKDDGAKVTGLVFTLQDMTEKVRAENGRRESEEIYLTVVETMTDTLSIIDTEGYFLYANPQAVKNLSPTMSEDITGKNIRDLLPVHEAEKLILNYQNTFNSKIPFTGEVKIHIRDKENWFLNRLIPFEWGINKIPSVLSMSLDITDRKKTEEALRENEKELQWILKSMLNAFVIFESVFDDKGDFISYRFIYINDSYEKITGVKNHEVKGKTVHEVWPATEDEWVKRYGQVAVTGISQTFDMYHSPTGKLYHCNAYRPWDTQDRFCVIFEDITERKRTEEALQESEKKFRSYMENAPDGIFLANEKGNYLLVNDSACTITGFTREELMQKNFIDLIFSEDIPSGMEHFRRVIEQGRASGEGRFITKSGEVRHWIVKAVKLNEKNFLGFAADITERRVAEEALRESESRLKKVLEILPVGVWITDKHGRIVQSNPAAEQIWSGAKYVGQEELHEYKAWWYDTKELIKPEEWGLSRAFRKGEISREELIEIECFNGTHKIMLNWAMPLIGANQEIDGAVAVNQDITERKLIEEDLKSAYTKLEALWSVSSMADADIKTISDHILGSITKMTGSDYGFYGFINEDESVMTIHSWSGEAMKDCSMVDKPCRFNIEEAGVWAEAIRQRKPFILNDYNVDHLAKKGLPERHVDLTNLLVVPFFSQGRITSVAAVANRALTYSQEDINQITSFLTGIQSIVEHKKTGEYIRLMADMLDEAPGAITFHDFNGKFLYANRKTFEIHGYNKDEFMSLNLHELDVPESETLIQERIELINRYGEASFEVKHIKKDGRIFPLNIFVKKVTWKDIPAMLSIATDITERKMVEEEKERLQSQLIQAQKMESVGRLAGGVAHDFNNMLGIILGFTELALEQVEQKHNLYDHLKSIEKAATRSADLTRQLLAFARKQTIAPKLLDMNDTVSGMLRMIRRLIGEDIDLAWMPGVKLWPVMVDPAQIDQILANLCVNARDAIKGVGKITIETENIIFDDNYRPSHRDFTPGEYVMLSVSDDGCGMDKHVTEHLFEPFFTTKEIGKGTGLGLATIYGIVRQNRGFINVYSEPGMGSTFKIYLPRFVGKDREAATRGRIEDIQKGSETVLLVEDEREMMDMIKIMLERLGYRVLTAITPLQAIKLAEDYSGEINLLITDVVMPEMNGRYLAEKLMSLYCNMKCLFMSGYTANVIAHHGVLEEGLMFIEKPFTRKDLAEKVRKALGP